VPHTDLPQQIDSQPSSTPQATEVQDASTKTRLRIRHTKRGDMRWISHRDLARVWERLLRRAGLQLAFSQGFHPKPRISFPTALALGIEALDEVVEMEVVGEVDLQSIEHLLRRELPLGMELLELQALESSLGKAKVLGASYRIEHGLQAASSATLESPQASSKSTCENLDELQQRITGILAKPQVMLERDGKQVGCATEHPYFELKITGECFTFSLPTLPQGSIRPSELLDHVGLGHLLEAGATLQRTAVHLLS